MANVLILGAGGQVPAHVIERLKTNKAIKLTLYLRNANRLEKLQSANIRVVEGDILDSKKLTDAMQGQDIVYVNINGQEDLLTQQILNAMQTVGVKRLIFIAAIGIYDEVSGDFGKWNEKMIGPILQRYKQAANQIEASGIDYTILRPTWYTDKDEIDYKFTQKGTPITCTEISRKSVADMVVNLIEKPELYIGTSLGLEKPGTEGNKPSFMQ
ncbi:MULTISPECIES: NAD(P)H-binding protein [Niastella]|uniref:NAD(P)H-binding protein n=1 Tax=Niastella soli TaxID=2821487 RepID=A0ABS3YX47_9BACT|nr:NAD(P)H-binding protein [Niastella soli]MBO9201985.1 NAD(P)H-binding protein [Niastella soli]